MNTAYMMTIEEKNNFEISTVPTLVVGIGKTGFSCLQFLVANGVPSAITDSRDNPPYLNEIKNNTSNSYKNVTCSVGGFDAELFEWAQRIIVSPGISINEPLIKKARERGAEIIGDVEIFSRLAKAPIVAITGSNGKSTVTTLVSEMINGAGKKALMGGNIGTPVLDLLLEPVPDFYVLELSSFQLETTYSLNAAVSVVLNVSPDHMDRYPDLEHYAAAKQRIYGLENKGLENKGLENKVTGNLQNNIMVVNRDDATVMSMVHSGHDFISFGLDEPSKNNFGRVTYEKEIWLAYGKERLLPVKELRIRGEHNQANVLAALALGKQINLPVISMLETLRQFSGLPHRTQWIANINNVEWINDSKGTNVGATVSAIRGFTNPLVLIAGGQGKGADFSLLRDAVKQNTRAAILLGEDALLIKEAIGETVPVTCVDNMENAVQQAHSIAVAGDVVLLSPACASFDMYDGFEDRGNAFINTVRSLQNGGAS